MFLVGCRRWLCLFDLNYAFRSSTFSPVFHISANTAISLLTLSFKTSSQYILLIVLHTFSAQIVPNGPGILIYLIFAYLNLANSGAANLRKFQFLYNY